jgi:hypothetical protein
MKKLLQLYKAMCAALCALRRPAHALHTSPTAHA